MLARIQELLNKEELILKSTITQHAEMSIGVGTAIRSMEKADWNKRYSINDFVWTSDANRFLVAEVADLSPRRALDLAAGEGRNAVWLAEKGWFVNAVDFADVALWKGKRLATERNVSNFINFHEADLRNYEPGEGCFDLVAVIYLQIPMEELLPILVKAVKALVTGGTFLLIAHDSENLLRGFGGPRNPDVLYSAEEIAVALNGYLTIEKSERVERLVKTSHGDKVAIDCLVRGTCL